ncbi:hypothetical protein Glove_132g148 [Diversispora epigaea]|uniref:Protein kinase domain-containing protein n=1 Tax=Diversispora epigaea TaxID=1348612 RepID=A0A397J1B0_9GLOM|nr:hypothetical protein Glove_132g148 [Diversispora epigaea]
MSKKDLFKSGGENGTVYLANSTSLGKHVILKSLHENGKLFYEKFVKELTNLMAVNNHDNVINFYGINPQTKTLDWEIKIRMTKDITSILVC